jgi:glycosyltransferase involved in cell wall biosynthesis
MRVAIESQGARVRIEPRRDLRDVAGYEDLISRRTQLLSSSGVDLVFLNGLHEWTAACAAQRLSTASIWAVHETDETSVWENDPKRPRRLNRHIAENVASSLPRATQVVVGTEASADAWTQLVRSRPRVIPYGVDPDAIARFATDLDKDAVRLRNDLTPADRVVLCVQCEEIRQNAAGIAEAFGQLASVHQDAVLVLIGDPPAGYETTIPTHIDDSGVTNRVRIVPMNLDLREWFAIADIVASVSETNSLPLAVLNAMAFARPCLAPDSPGIREVIEEGRTGWLYTTRDVRALTAALHLVLSLPREALRSVGDAALTAVRTGHSLSSYVSAYGQLIESAMDPRSPRTQLRNQPDG